MEPQATPFDLKFGAALRKRMARDRKDRQLSDMIPGILLARTNGGPERLEYGWYPVTRASDHVLFELFEADGVCFFVPQPQVREMLTGKTLDLDKNGRLAALPRPS